MEPVWFFPNCPVSNDLPSALVKVCLMESRLVTEITCPGLTVKLSGENLNPEISMPAETSGGGAGLTAAGFDPVKQPDKINPEINTNNIFFI